MSVSSKQQELQQLEIDFNGKKLQLEKNFEKNSVDIYLTSYNKNFRGSVVLEEIVSQIPLFEDYNIQEVFDVIKEQKLENYSLIEEVGKYYLTIKILILKREKKLNINLVAFEKTFEKTNSEKGNKNTINNYINDLPKKNIASNGSIPIPPPPPPPKLNSKGGGSTYIPPPPPPPPPKLNSKGGGSSYILFGENKKKI